MKINCGNCEVEYLDDECSLEPERCLGQITNTKENCIVKSRKKTIMKKYFND